MARKKMSAEHKEALARGREQGRAVRDYLAALERGKQRGPKMDKAGLERRIDELHRQIEEEDNPAKRVELIQRRLDFEDRLSTVDEEPDLEDLERRFVEAAAEYSQRKGITYTAWREAGVPAPVLKAAGIPRTRRTN